MDVHNMGDYVPKDGVGGTMTLGDLIDFVVNLVDDTKGQELVDLMDKPVKVVGSLDENSDITMMQSEDDGAICIIEV